MSATALPHTCPAVCISACLQYGRRLSTQNHRKTNVLKRILPTSVSWCARCRHILQIKATGCEQQSIRRWLQMHFSQYSCNRRHFVILLLLLVTVSVISSSSVYRILCDAERKINWIHSCNAKKFEWFPGNGMFIESSIKHWLLRSRSDTFCVLFDTEPVHEVNSFEVLIQSISKLHW